MSCTNNLKQIGLALHKYADSHNAFPYSKTTTFPQHSWTAAVLPYLEQENLYKLYNYKVDWNAPANWPAIQTRVKVFNCPSTPLQDTTAWAPAQPGGPQPREVTDYGAINAIKDFVGVNCFGLQGVTKDDPRIMGGLVRDKPTRFADILDGTSNTILIAEDAGRPQFYAAGGTLLGIKKEGGWADPNGPFSIDGSNPDGTVPGPCPLNCSNDSEVYAFHTGGANAVFGDGSVHFLSRSISLCTLAKLTTRAGGEIVDSSQY
jgi:prepilin-type processing-associated H-X9-DG protein